MKALKASNRVARVIEVERKDKGDKRKDDLPNKLTRVPSLADTHPPKFGENSRSTSVAWPSSLVQEVISTFTRPIRETEAKRFVAKHNWSRGLGVTSYELQKNLFGSFIVDDSGSMATNDGNRIIRTHGGH